MELVKGWHQKGKKGGGLRRFWLSGNGGGDVFQGFDPEKLS